MSTKKYRITKLQNDGSSLLTLHPETDADIVLVDNSSGNYPGSATNVQSALKEVYSNTDKKIKGLASGTTSGNLVKWGADGYTVEDAGVTITTSAPNASSSDFHIPTAKAVWDAIDSIPEPMIFKGTLGTGGTISTLPSASSSNEGYTYKVITAGEYQGLDCNIGDIVVSTGSEWVLIPSGDDSGSGADTWRNIKVNGSQVLGNGISTGALDFVDGDSIAFSFSSGAIHIETASGYTIPSNSQITDWNAKYDLPSGGIPVSDLASAVQSSLSKADSALQSNQTITLSGDVSGSGTTSIPVTIDKDTTVTSESTKPVTSGAVYNAVQDVREVAEGKTATYVCSDVSNVVLNSQDDTITVNSALVDIDGNSITIESMSIGDNVYVTETNVPDRWVSGKRTQSDLNLFNNDVLLNASGWAKTSDELYYGSPATMFAMYGVRTNGFPNMTFETNTQYTIQYTVTQEIGVSGTRLRVYYTDNTYTDGTSFPSGTGGKETFTTTSGKTVSKIAMAYTDGTGTISFYHVMVVKGVYTAQTMPDFGAKVADLSKLETTKVDLTNYVDKSSAQTISGAKTFSISPVLNNSTYLNCKTSSGTEINLIGISSGNNILIDPSGVGNIVTYATLRPNANNSKDLGTSSYKWKDLYLAGNLSDGTNSLNVASIPINNARVETAPSGCTKSGFYNTRSTTNSLSGADANPFLQFHQSQTDFRIIVNAYNDSYVQQIATDYYTDHIFYRRRTNTTWTNWVEIGTGGGSGISISGGYNFSPKFTNKFMFLGMDKDEYTLQNLNYGWHKKTTSAGGITFENVSMVVITDLDFDDSVTPNSLMAYDGTLITNANLSSYLNKLLYLIDDCSLWWADE